MHFGACALVVHARPFEARRDFVDALAVFAEHVGDGKELTLVGPRTGNGPAVGNAVEQRARRREAERACTHRIVDKVAHGRNVVVGRGRLVESAFAHRVVAQRAVTDHSSDVHALGQAVDPAEVFAVGLPVPREARQNALGRNVLDRLHQLREPALLTLADGSEGNAAIPQHY
jgi:hypothetical protein